MNMDYFFNTGWASVFNRSLICFFGMADAMNIL